MITDRQLDDPADRRGAIPARRAIPEDRVLPVAAARTGRDAVVASLLGALVVALLVWAAPASAQELTEQPQRTSVALVPAASQADDPHNGTWFVMTLVPGETGQQVATVVNPTNEPKTVDLDIRHVDFAAGELRLAEDPAAGIASWGRFEREQVTVAPRDRLQVPFTLTVPQSGIEPRDYVGAAVATTTSQVGNATVVQRVATRIYVTVPGQTAHRFEVSSVDPQVDSAWWPRSVLVTATVKNTGTIRIAPTVTIAGQPARGPRFVLAGTEEQFLVDLPAPLVASSMSLPVDVADDSGTVRRVNTSSLVVRWGFLVALLAVVLAGWVTLRWWRRHESRYAQLERDMRRLERLVASMRMSPANGVTGGSVTGGGEPGAGSAGTFADEEELGAPDGEHRFHVALKRARRTGDREALARLALRRHLSGDHDDALPFLLEALKERTAEHAALAQAAASYGPEALGAAVEGSGLSDSTRRMLYGLARAEPVAVGDQHRSVDA